MKNELNLDEFLQKAGDIAVKWKDIPILEYIPITPPKNNTPKNEIVKLPKPLENRINWKSIGVLNSILRKTNEFYESQKDVFTEDENTELNIVVSTKSKEESIEYIKRLLSKLNKRRKRSKYTQ